jgi:multisubunit Na+/H+ antiporter MnhB subunit
VVLGVVPGLLYDLVAPAVDIVVGAPTAIDLALWYGFNTALLLSVITVALGVAGYAQWDRLRAGLQRMDRWARYGPQAAYDGGLALTLRAAAWQTRFFDGISVRQALAATFAVVAALAGGTLLLEGEVAFPGTGLDVMLHEWALAGAIAAAAIVATQLRSTVTTLAVVGIVGVGLALFFAMLSAPDLAMTQFLVEILTVVIMLLVLQKLPRHTRPEPRSHRLRDAGIAVALGAMVTTVLLAVLQRPLDLTVPQYYLTESVPQGFGRNVVNVILVDFRALDTLGEITVIAVAALGAVLLLRGLRWGTAPTRTILHPPSLVLQTGTRLMLTLLILAALFMLWRGHNEPGGGFIGGLMASTAIVLYLIAFGRRATGRIVPVASNIGLGGGLAVAVASGFLAVIVGAPYMTGQWTTLGTLKLGTPLLFDVGVFIVVVSFVLTIVFALERTVHAPRRVPGRESPSQRSPAPEATKRNGVTIRREDVTARPL